MAAVVEKDRLAPAQPEQTQAEVEALIKEARRRQRRRRTVAAALLVLTGIAPAIYFGFFANANGRQQAQRSRPAAVAAQTLRLHLAGFGTPLPTQIDEGPCPNGRTVISIESPSGATTGSVHGCVLTISQMQTATGALKRIDQTARETYSLPGGTIISREEQTIHFAPDQHRTTSVFRGQVIGGSGRYAHAHGSVSGGGPGIDDKANWLVKIELR